MDLPDRPGQRNERLETALGHIQSPAPHRARHVSSAEQRRERVPEGSRPAPSGGRLPVHRRGSAADPDAAGIIHYPASRIERRVHLC